MDKMALLGHGHKNTEQQQEIRETRRLLKEKIRDDWEYPPLPEWQSGSSGRRKGKAQGSDEEQRVAGFRFHTPGEGVACAATCWREREYSSESNAEGGSPTSATSAGSKGSSNFKFDGPDSVGTQISQRRLARRRKRQRDLETEMSWNPGLAHWMRQRDAWAGAGTAQPQVHEVERPETVSGTSTPRTSSSHSDNTSSPATDRSSAATTPDPAPASNISLPPTSAPSAPQADILIPVAAPILPNHPIRRRITPAMFAEIYTKIIVQGRTPSVPINLLTLISALVEGWKADGEWPPRSAPVEPSLARKKGAKDEGAIKHGVKAVGKVLRLTHAGHGHGHGEGG